MILNRQIISFRSTFTIHNNGSLSYGALQLQSALQLLIN